MGAAPDIRYSDGIASGRLSAEEVAENFGDIHPPLDQHEALVAADRCYFCYDAPCVTACPTEIDIPMFIRQIATGNTLGAAQTIFDQNILGGMCARVCPTETLCEQACVREEAEGKPVLIGQLQRFATDQAMREERQFYSRAEASGKSVGIIGAGPAGLACAHRLAMHGHDVVIYEAKPKPGGLNEYGIAAYKTIDDFAQHEVDYVTAIGGIDIRYDTALGKDVSLDDLRAKHDAVFIGIGLGGVNALSVEGNDLDGVEDAVDFIARLRQADNKSDIAVGRDIVVIGGGMTAVDCAVQAKLLGAENVTIAYRRGQEHMNASQYEQELAATTGVRVRHNLQPKALLGQNDAVTAIELEYTQVADGKLSGTGQTITLEADQVFRAIGQSFEADLSDAGIDMTAGRIATIGAHGQTSAEGIWAGGDCVAGGDDLTVTAVAQGRDAAENIHAALSGVEV
ncbi:MAG: NAD(P)-dependent oxidoreductase [Ahrensia sp.]|nr:NAD(P)-dependent oxidoreductase [Ahrensia sp.]